MTLFKKIGCLAVLLLLLVGAGFFMFNYYWVFGEGVKAGVLNYSVKKGYVFKTYEGKLIQDGFKPKADGVGLQNNEFEFSVEDAAIGDSLMRCTGHKVELRYKEYKNALPWRGMSVYVVDGILSVDDKR